MLDEVMLRLVRRLSAWKEHGDRATILDPATLDDIRAAHRAGNALPGDDLDRVRVVHVIATVHWERFKASDQDERLTAEALEATQLFQDLYRLDPRFAPPELHQLFSREVDPEESARMEAEAAASALTTMVDALRRGVVTVEDHEALLAKLDGLSRDFMPPGHPCHSLALAYLARELRTGYERFGREADLAQALEAGREALRHAGPEHSHRPICVSVQANSLTTQSLRTGEHQWADEAADLLRATLDLLDLAHPTRPSLLNSLGSALMAVPDQHLDRDRHDEAVTAFRAALAHHDDNGHVRTAAAANLSRALARRHARYGTVTDLDEAIGLLQDVLLRPVEAENEPAQLTDEYMRLVMPDLAEAARAPHTDQAGSSVLHLALSRHLRTRFEQNGARQDLIEAVEHARKAASADSAASPAALVHLTSVLIAYHDDQGGEDILTELTETAQRAFDSIPRGHEDHCRAVCHLGMVMRTRFHRLGGRPDLDEAVRLGREAVGLATGDVDRTMCLLNLSTSLRSRAIETGSSSDIDEAVRTAEVAERCLSTDHPDRAMLLRTEGDLLRIRHWMTQDPADLDHAITLLGEALTTTPMGSATWPTVATALAKVLRKRHELTRDDADLRFAITLSERVLEHPGAGSAGTADSAVTLANALLVRSRSTEGESATGDLDRCVELLRSAVALTPRQDDRAVLLMTLGHALSDRHTRTQRPEDAAAAADAYRQVAQSDTSASYYRLSAAGSWASCCWTALGDSTAALRAYELAIDLLPEAAWRGVEEDSRERALGSQNGLLGTAAACAVANGDAERALELVEQGRTVIWSQRLELRSDLTALRAAAPEAADRLTAARTGLRSLEVRSADGGEGSAAREQRMALAREWEAGLAQARRVPGFESFLRTPPAGHLVRAAAAGPVIVVGSVHPRCDALVVRPDGVTPVPLDVTVEEVAANVAAFLIAAHGPGDDQDLADILRREEELSGVLGWLWDVFAGPVLDELGYTEAGSETLPRLWWCPVGLMSLLPLHAAGHHGAQNRETVLDRAVSSYTPTLSTLIRSRERPITADDRDDPFLIVRPDTPGMAHLPSTTLERDLVSHLLGPGRCSVLDGPAARVENVLAALRSHRWFHLNGHGTQHLGRPSAGAVHLSDGELRITDLSQAERHDGEFAFLSACDTMTGGVAVPDEVMTLASAVQFAGFRHVIGTLWPTADTVAAQLSALLYPQLIEDGRIRSDGSARALHASVVQLRDAAPDLPNTWASFVHTGP
ncbi:CHAT domain-containing protein [Streptomyces sp. NPDC008240]|uniref:CHAT domain-containing tetratricopeptide repeat protein n=1 Tax=Streptomyces sp. NPDC008240 TaxID=3364822 RepID=UPI0036EDBE0D